MTQETAQSLHLTKSQEWKLRVSKKPRDHQTGETERPSVEIKSMSKLR